jgi:hypothetical protein
MPSDRRIHTVNRRDLRAWFAVLGPPLVVGAVVFGCGGTASRPGSAPSATSATTSAAATTSQGKDVVVTNQSFRSLRAMTPIRGFFVDNLLGDLPASIAVANSRNGGVYPPGTLLQLVPQEAMVKHRAGWGPTTNDWEFFFLDVSATGTKIVDRGTTTVVNRFGGNCASCHSAAAAKFDLVCEHDHGCAPLPVSDDTIRLIQLADPRPTS